MTVIDFPEVKILIQEVRSSPMSKVIRVGTMGKKVALFLNEEDFTLFQELRDFAQNKGKVEEAIVGYLNRPGSDAVVRMVFNQPGEAIIKYDIMERPTGTKFGAKDGRKYASKVRFRHLLELLRLGFYLVLEACAVNPNVRYVQVFAGFETLALEAERIKMRFPLSKTTIARYIPAETTISMTRPRATFWTEPADMRKYPEPATNKRSAIFKLELVGDFLGGDYNTLGLEKVKENFFSPSQRNMLFYSIMSRCKVSIEGHHLKKLSVKQLIHHLYYKDVYTPHSGLVDFATTSNFFSNDLRAKLVQWSKRYSKEPVPLTNIRLYFGENVFICLQLGWVLFRLA
jgi:Dimerisation domain of Ca+-activated chloride-channel, anoctamin